MMQLSSVLIMCAVIGGIVGYLRGWSKEIVATAGIILALFIQEQFRNILFDPLTAGASAEAKFYLYIILFLLVAFFAYQTPSQASRLSSGRLYGGNRRESLTERTLGLVVGLFNGYLIFGTVWYYLDSFGYPFNPYFIAPAPGSPSAQLVASGILPLTWLVQGNLLTIVVIVLFLFVIVTMI
jgi:uncharacterized membrane protein required for colicin V production